MKKAILTIVLLLAFVWCICPPVDDNLDWGWLLGEAIGFAVLFFCGHALKKYENNR